MQSLHTRHFYMAGYVQGFRIEPVDTFSEQIVPVIGRDGELAINWDGTWSLKARITVGDCREEDFQETGQYKYDIRKRVCRLDRKNGATIVYDEMDAQRPDLQSALKIWVDNTTFLCIWWTDYIWQELLWSLKDGHFKGVNKGVGTMEHFKGTLVPIGHFNSYTFDITENTFKSKEEGEAEQQFEF